MPIKKFELYHGAVLAKILRADRPTSLRLVETRPSQDWSSYTVNDAVNLFVCHRGDGREFRQSGGGVAWTFVFSKNQLRQLSGNPDGRPTWAALVGASANMDGTSAVVCLLSPEEIRKFIDLGANKPQSLTIRKPASKGKLRIVKGKKEVALVAQNRIDTWKIPA